MKFLSDGAYLLAAQLVARLLAFSLTFVVARTLGLEQLAMLGLAQSLVGFATVAGDAGLGTSAVQRIARGEDSHQVVHDTARAQVWISIVASLAMVPIIATQTDILLALSLCLTPMVIAATATYVLQARLQARKIAVGQIAGNLLVASVGILLAVIGLPLGVVALVYPAGLFLTMIIVNAQAKVSIRDIVGLPHFAHFVRDGRSYASLLFYTLVVHAYSACLLILSQNLASGRHFEGTGLASRMLILMVIPSVILGSMMLPRFAAVPPSAKRLSLLTGAAFLAGALLATANALLAPVYVPLLFGPEAVPYIGAVQLVGAQVPFSFACTILTSAALAERRFVSTGLAYALALLSQITFALLFSQFSTSVFVLAISVSECIFLMVLASQRFLLSRGTS